jgi:aspartate aminotransferase
MLTDFQQDGATVMVAPAQGFYASPGLGANEVRIAYVLKEDDLRAAVALIAAGLAAYREARDLASVPGAPPVDEDVDFHVPAES